VTETGLRRFARQQATARESPPGEEEGTTSARVDAVRTAPPEALATPPEALATPPEGLATPPEGLATLPEALASRLSAGQNAPTAGAAERCEMCAAEVPAEHGHVADLDAASLVCACRACYLLFTQDSAGRGRYRAVPDRYLSDAPLTSAEWDELQVPVGLAFFLHSSVSGELTAFYPSPAGATQCELDLAAWQRLEASHPLLAAAAPDVEAVLVSNGAAGAEVFLVPVDVCYELVGRMRLQWRGFDGGSEARESIGGFLDGVRSRAKPYLAEAGSG
jgi:Family of unknown function (DUF5947)